MQMQIIITSDSFKELEEIASIFKPKDQVVEEKVEKKKKKADPENEIRVIMPTSDITADTKKLINAMSDTAKKTEPEEPTLTLEETRKRLAEISKSGKRDEVKGLITAIGYNSLTEVPAEHYAGLIEKAEAL